MRRLHLLEIHDQAWCPRAIRNAVTDYLQAAIELGRPYQSATKKLAIGYPREAASAPLPA